MKTILLVFSLLLSSCYGYTQSGETSASQDLAVGVFLTSGLEEVRAAHTVQAFNALDRIHVFQRGEPVTVMVILKGYRPQSREFILEGACEIVGPDGEASGNVPSCVNTDMAARALGGPDALFVPPDVVYLIGGFLDKSPSTAPSGTFTVRVRISEMPNRRLLGSAAGRFNLGYSSSAIQDLHSTAYRSQAELNAVFAAYTSSLAHAGASQGAYGSEAATRSYQPHTSYGGIGAKFGTRDPATCPSRTEPTSGSISVEQAARYFMCSREEVGSGHITLVQNLMLTVATGRRASSAEWQLTGDMNPDSVVYPIRGSLTVYTCTIPNRSSYGFLNDVGRNCETYDEPQAEGKCYRTSFGDWRCSMTDANHLQYNFRQKVAPPR